MGGGGLNREGGLINFPPLKRGGGLLERGGLFERGGGLNRGFTVYKRCEQEQYQGGGVGG